MNKEDKAWASVCKAHSVGLALVDVFDASSFDDQPGEEVIIVLRHLSTEILRDIVALEEEWSQKYAELGLAGSPFVTPPAFIAAIRHELASRE